MCSAVCAMFLITNSIVLSVSVASIASNRFTSTMGLIPFIYLVIVMFTREKTIIIRPFVYLQSAEVYLKLRPGTLKNCFKYFPICESFLFAPQYCF